LTSKKILRKFLESIKDLLIAAETFATSIITVLDSSKDAIREKALQVIIELLKDGNTLGSYL
jgi:hypothetical protein